MTEAINPLVHHDEEQPFDTGPASRHDLRRRYDAITRRLARAHLPSTFALLDVAGRAANVLSLDGPSSSDVAALYGARSRWQLGRIARGITALHLKNRASIALVQSGRIADLAARVRWPDESARRTLLDGQTGVLVAACHVGAFFGIRAALHGAARPVFMMRDLTLLDAASRAAALKRAVDALRAGEVVVGTLDGPGGASTREVTCLGRRIVLRRGAFTLARITGAPVVPVVCAWTPRQHIEMRVAPPIARPDRQDLNGTEFEDDMAMRTAAWIDAYLRAHPQEIWPSTLRYYLAAPRA